VGAVWRPAAADAADVITSHPARHDASDSAYPAINPSGLLMHQDLELEEQVREALARDSRLANHKAIAVSARAGVVTLRGLPHDPRDDELRGSLLQALIWDPRLRDHEIDA